MQVPWGNASNERFLSNAFPSCGVGRTGYIQGKGVKGKLQWDYVGQESSAAAEEAGVCGSQTMIPFVKQPALLALLLFLVGGRAEVSKKKANL